MISNYCSISIVMATGMEDTQTDRYKELEVKTESRNEEKKRIRAQEKDDGAKKGIPTRQRNTAKNQLKITNTE